MITVPENNLCGRPLALNHSISFPNLASAIKHLAAQYGINLRIEEDTIKIGSGFFKTPERCLVVYNAQHLRDYNCYALVQRPQGNISFVSMYLAGRSNNYAREVSAKSMGGIAGYLMRPDRQAQERELAYYQTVQSIIGTALHSI